MEWLLRSYWNLIKKTFLLATFSLSSFSSQLFLLLNFSQGNLSNVIFVIPTQLMLMNLYNFYYFIYYFSLYSVSIQLFLTLNFSQGNFFLFKFHLDTGSFRWGWGASMANRWWSVVATWQEVGHIYWYLTIAKQATGTRLLCPVSLQPAEEEK